MGYRSIPESTRVRGAQNSATWSPDVPEQELHDGGGADHLHAERVLRPRHRIGNGRRSLAAAIRAKRLRNVDDLTRRDSADLRDRFGGVARIVAFEYLVNAAGMFQRFIHHRRRAAVQRVFLLFLALARFDSGFLLTLTGRAVQVHAFVHP